MGEEKKQLAAKKISRRWFVVGAIAFVLFVAICLFIFWATNNGSNQTGPPQSNTIQLQREKVPQGWRVDGYDGENLLLKNDANNCFVSVNKLYDSALRVSDTDEYLTVRADTAKAEFTAQGYEVITLPRSQVTLLINASPQNIPSLEFSLKGSAQSFRQSYGYVVRDGYSVQVQRSCPNELDLPSTTDALKAVKIQV